MEKDCVIYVVGAGDFPIYEKALYDAFIELGYANSKLITWKEKYKTDGILFRYLTRLEHHFGVGSQTTAFNKYLIDICIKDKPDILFLYSCRMVYPKTIKMLRSLGIYIASYCNDDPFSERYKPYFWINYKNSLKYCDVNYVYRHTNINDVERITGRPGELLRAYYIEASNYPCSQEEIIEDVPDVIFLGHIEDDERSEYLNSIVEKNIKIGLNKLAYGDWSRGKKNVVFLDNPRDWYNRYLCSCKIPLVFLSKLNRDTYTRRCFEIPAAGAFLFCPYTEDLASMFEENKEVVFYRSKNEFIDKIEYYLKHDEDRIAIAQAGRRRLLRDGHEVKNRARQVLDDYYEKEIVQKRCKKEK